MNEHERYFFDLNGYLVIEGVLTRAELAAANRAIDALQLPVPPPDEGSPRFHGFLSWEEPLFRRLMDHPRIVPYLKDIIGEGFRLDHEYGIYMRRSAAGLALHGGGTPFDPSQYYHVHDDRMFNGLIVVSWASPTCLVFPRFRGQPERAREPGPLGATGGSDGPGGRASAAVSRGGTPAGSVAAEEQVITAASRAARASQAVAATWPSASLRWRLPWRQAVEDRATSRS